MVSEAKELRSAEKRINFHEEYHRALRTKSYSDFFNKAQLLKNQPSIYQNKKLFSEILLEPSQETIIPWIVESAILSKIPKLKKLMFTYFNISAEASHICSYLLESTNQVKYNDMYIQRTLDIIMDDHDHDHDESLDKFSQINFELDSFIMFSKNPFSNLINNEFKLISDNHSSLLHHLKSMRKSVGKKIKVMMFWKFPRSEFVGEINDQIDIAAKGTYILNRDFDTMSGLVTRVHDEVEHKKAMVKFCLERKYDRLCMKIMREVMKKSEIRFRKQVEELEEHVYLCLLTINRARCLVMKEILTKTCLKSYGM
ncbi:UPF0496 protein At1g20180-like [Cicer arietinum]|uniref:UPF0496 protein 3-like n=1 Tax=Cicer arietinum TaxID=3827 RepID=A0A1S2YUD6_CICAR|nr:UPF0496 protein 3-like [Cicer arietinum]